MLLLRIISRFVIEDFSNGVFIRNHVLVYRTHCSKFSYAPKVVLFCDSLHIEKNFIEGQQEQRVIGMSVPTDPNF